MKKDDLGCQLRYISNLMRQHGEVDRERIGKGKVTFLHGWIITYLYHHPDHNISQKDIEKEFHIGKSTLSAILQLMEKNNLVIRETAKGDARQKYIRLTEEGRQFGLEFEKGRDKADEDLEVGISPEDMQVFGKVMEQIITNAERIKAEDVQYLQAHPETKTHAIPPTPKL